MAHRSRDVYEFNVGLSDDHRTILLNFREANGDELTLRLSIDNAAEWLGQNMKAIAAAGIKRAPRAAGSRIPPNELHIAYPMEVSLNAESSEPTLVMDFRAAAIGFRVDRGSLTHVVQHLLTRYPVGKPGSKN